jgi:RNA methyltransferase, TrmH family
MLTNAEIKRIKLLHEKSTRRESGLFIAEGDKICKELLESKTCIKGIYALQDWVLKNEKELKNINNVITISEKELSRISGLKTPNQVLVIAESASHKLLDIDLHGNITIVLDTIQDAGNLGTIIRTADWFGVENIICSNETVELYNPKVIQSSMGSILRTKVIYTHLKDFFKTLPSNIPVYGTFLEGISIAEINFPKECILVFGNESKGISQDVAQFVKTKTTIPSFTSKRNNTTAESLNASVAAAIYLAKAKMG